MGKKLAHKAMKIHMDDTMQQVLDIFEAEDGRTFDEKKKRCNSILSQGVFFIDK